MGTYGPETGESETTYCAASAAGAGAGHGGSGGNSFSVNGGDAYDNLIIPNNLGSGGGTATVGGCAALDNTQNPGGGIIELDLSGTLTLNGEITADAPNQTHSRYGGGAGGSIYIDTDTIIGSGLFTANGSNATGLYAGSGGGGRIAVYYATNAGFGTGTSTANGGTGGANNGNNGSIIWVQDYNLVLTSDAEITPDVITEVPSWNSITIQNASTTTVNGGLIWTTSGTLQVTGNSVLVAEATNTGLDTGAVGVTVDAVNITVDNGSTISAKGEGYIGSHGPGQGDSETTTCNAFAAGAGAGHGGNGGDSFYGSGGVNYDEQYAPDEAGSGGGIVDIGGCIANDTSQNPGGGAFRLNVSGTLTNNGDIDAGAKLPTADRYGGGSGGAIYVTTDILTGSGLGTFTSDGANIFGGFAGGGAGGRVAIYYYTSGDCSDFTLSANKGTGYDAAHDGNDGTVVCGQPVPSHLDFTTGDTAQIAGATNTTVLTALDQYGNPAINYTGVKSITYSGASTAPDGISAPTVNGINFGAGTSITFTNGVGSNASMVLYKVETAEVEADDGSISTGGDPDYDLNVIVSDAGADHVDFTDVAGVVANLSTQTAGTAIADLYVSALDAYDNVDTNYAAGTVTILGGDANAPGNAPDGTIPDYPDSALTWGIDDTNGVMYFDPTAAAKWIKLFAKETGRQIKADDSILTDKNSNTFNINPGSIQSYDVSVSSPQTAGTGFNGTATAKDAYLNTVTTDNTTQITPSDTGSANFYLDGAYLIPVSNYTLSSGVATLYIKDTVAENTVFSVIDSNLKTGSSGSITINPASATQISISSPATATAGTAFNVTFTAKDPYGNTDTNYNSALILTGLNTSPNSDAPSYGSGNFSSGVITRSITGYASGSQNIQADSGAISATSSAISFSAKSINLISISPSSDQTIRLDETKQFSATSYDQYGNSRSGDSFVWNNASSSGLFTGANSGTFSVYAVSGSIVSNKVNVTVLDTQAPLAPNVNIPSDNQVFDVHQPTFSGTGEANLDVIITIGGKSYTTDIDANGNWSYQIPDQLKDGEYTALFKVRDDAGNDSESIERRIIIDTEKEKVTEKPKTQKAQIRVMIDNVTIDVIKIDNGKEGKGAIAVLPQKDVLFYVTPKKDKTVSSVVGYFENQRYEFEDKDGDGVYEYDLATPNEKGEYIFKIVVTYEDGEMLEEEISITVDPFGYVYTINLDGEQRIKDAEVTCWKINDKGIWEVWNATEYNQKNPQFTPANGEYAFFVPPGIFKLTSVKSGYYDYQSADFVVEQGKPVNINILMSKRGFAGAVANIARAYLDFKEYIKPYVDTPAYQTSALTANSVSAVAVALSALLPFILNFGLMSSPLANLWLSLMAFLGLAKKTKNPWGVVYDTESKQPIANAIVQIYDAKFNKLLETVKTDIDGRFAFLVEPGVYYIKVYKKDYAYPTKIDAQSYSGKVFKVSKSKITDFNIGLDPNMKKLFIRAKIVSNILNVINYIRIPVLVIGTILAIGNFVAFTSALNTFILLLYVAVWIIEIFNIIRNIKTFGNIYDRSDKHGLDLAIMRLFDENSGKLIATKVTNVKGNYNFLVAKGKYHSLITKQQYKQYKSDPVAFKKGEAITKDYGLKKASHNA